MLHYKKVDNWITNDHAKEYFFLRCKEFYLKSFNFFIALIYKTILFLCVKCMPSLILQMLITGYRNTSLVMTAAKLKIPDLLNNNPATSDEIADFLQAHSGNLKRFMRALVCLGLVKEDRLGRFHITSMGALLQSERSKTLRGAAIYLGETSYQAYSMLLRSITTGEVAFESFYHLTLFEYIKNSAELSKYYNQTFANDAGIGLLVYRHDFSVARTILDIGGGSGMLVCSILKVYPNLTGIVFDTENIVADAAGYIHKENMTKRCQAVAGDFMKEIPDGKDIYILARVLNNWDDQQASLILHNCHRAMKKTSKLLVIQKLIPERSYIGSEAVLGDMNALVHLGTSNRTKKELQKLLSDNGFQFIKTVSLDAYDLYMVEFAPNEKQ